MTNMAQTLSEQILSHAAGHPVNAGDVVTVNVDLVMMHDSLSPSIITVLHEELGAERVWDNERVVVVIDHVAPASTIQNATHQRNVRQWVKTQQIKHFFDVGRGISHQVLVEEELAQPGMVIAGSDSHSTAYGCVGAFGTGMGTTDIALIAATGKTWMRVPETVLVRATGGAFQPGVSAKDLALKVARTIRAEGATYATVEWHGVDFLSIGERMTLATLSIEVGGKAGIIPPTGPATAGLRVPDWLGVQEGATYAKIIDIDLATLEPQVSKPHLVDNVVDVSELESVAVDVVYIGTCTNGRYEDMAAAAKLLKGRTVAPGVRLIVVPSSSEALRWAAEDDTLNILLTAGAAIGTPGCGACIVVIWACLHPVKCASLPATATFAGVWAAPMPRYISHRQKSPLPPPSLAPSLTHTTL
jgi:methanogen homoaconitase large subunit